MMDNKGGRFRKKRVNFSQVSNDILRNENISLKAKGLYALIQSYITLEDFTLYKKFLMNKCKEGEKAFDAAWKELKDNGYLIQYKMREGANSFYYEYELLDTPLDPHFVPLENVGVENVPLQNVDLQNVGVINNTINNNTEMNNNLSNHISEDDVRMQIDYNCFNKIEKTQVDNLVMIMTEILNMNDSETIRVNSRTVSAKDVKQRFSKITYSHIQYVLSVMRSFTGHIDNIRQYIITTLYNAPATMDSYYQNQTMNDMYGKKRGDNNV
jgi:hypothetical protein